MQNLTMGWRGKVAYVFPLIMIMRNLKNKGKEKKYENYW